MTFKRSIGRITVGGEAGFRGTGALVSEDGLVLSAFHVIGDLEQSRKTREAVFNKGLIKVVFGDPKDGAEATWMVGDGRACCERYSFIDDWALLRLEARPGEQLLLSSGPFRLAQPTTDGVAFKTFGFPRYAAEVGNEILGTLGAVDADSRIIQLNVEGMQVGMQMGGISGAPVLVAEDIVGVIIQTLADENQQAMAATLFMLPIRKAIASYPGLLAWDDGVPVTFQDVVETNLPAAGPALDRVGEDLGLPRAKWQTTHVARRILASDLKAAARALTNRGLAPERAESLLDCVGAMAIHPDAVNALQQAKDRTPWIELSFKRLHWWSLRRAFVKEVTDRNRIVVVRMLPGHEESPRTAAQSSQDAAMAEIVGRVRTTLKRKIGGTLVEGMLSPTTDPAKADLRRFWLVLIGELRPNVVEALRARLPNARVIVGLVERSTCPEEWLGRLQPAFPALSSGNELDLLEVWEGAASQLQLPVEPEDDDI